MYVHVKIKDIPVAVVNDHFGLPVCNTVDKIDLEGLYNTGVKFQQGYWHTKCKDYGDWFHKDVDYKRHAQAVVHIDGALIWKDKKDEPKDERFNSLFNISGWGGSDNLPSMRRGTEQGEESMFNAGEEPSAVDVPPSFVSTAWTGGVEWIIHGSDTARSRPSAFFEYTEPNNTPTPDEPLRSAGEQLRRILQEQNERREREQRNQRQSRTSAGSGIPINIWTNP